MENSAKIKKRVLRERLPSLPLEKDTTEWAGTNQRRTSGVLSLLSEKEECEKVCEK